MVTTTALSHKPNADTIVQLTERLKAVQAENQLLGRLLKDAKVRLSLPCGNFVCLSSSPQLLLSAAQTSQKAPPASAGSAPQLDAHKDAAKQVADLQQQLSAAHKEQVRSSSTSSFVCPLNEHKPTQASSASHSVHAQQGHAASVHCRSKNIIRAQQTALEKSQSMQDDMADVLLSLKKEAEQKSMSLSTATKRLSVLTNKSKQTEGQLADALQHCAMLQQQLSEQSQALHEGRADNRRVHAMVAELQQDLQNSTILHGVEVNSNADAFQSLQERHQALQAMAAEQACAQQATQHHLEQQLDSAREELQSACQERSAAVAALQALQTCEEKARCNLHVGMTQIGGLQQELVEAQRQCSEKQATVVHLHDQLLALRKQLQETEQLLAGSRAALQKSQAVLGEPHINLDCVGARPPHSAQDCWADASTALQLASTPDEASSKPLINVQEGASSLYNTAAGQSSRAEQQLAHARQVEIDVMQSLQRELCRVHVLERMCLSDLAEINTLHHQLHASQQSAWALREHILVNANGASRLLAFFGYNTTLDTIPYNLNLRTAKSSGQVCESCLFGLAGEQQRCHDLYMDEVAGGK